MNIDVLGIINFDNKQLSPKLEKPTNTSARASARDLSDETIIGEQVSSLYPRLIEITNISSFDDDDEESFDQGDLFADDDDEIDNFGNDNNDNNDLYSDDDDIFDDNGLNDLGQGDEEDNY